MIKQIISWRPKTENIQQARQWAREYTEVCNKKHPQSNMEIFVERFGDAGTIFIITQYESLTEFDELHTNLLADDEWRAIWRKGIVHFTDDSRKVKIIESL
jgi:hypothetical protein